VTDAVLTVPDNAQSDCRRAGWRDNRKRYFCADRNGSGTLCGTWRGVLLHLGRDRLCVCGTLLCGVRSDDSCGWFGLHVCVCVCNLIAFLGVMLVTAILVVGIKESANLNGFIVAVKLLVLVVFLVLGAETLGRHPEVPRLNWHPFLPANTGAFGAFGWSGVLRAAGVTFFAYPLNAVSTAAQETKNPKRDMPVGILGSLLICTMLYILVALVLTGVMNYKLVNVRDSLAVGIDVTGVKWGSLQVKLGALGGLTNTMMVMLLGQSRVFFSMSNDGLLPGFFSKMHPKFRTPWISSLTVGLVVAVYVSTIPLDKLGEMTSIGTLLAFTIVCAGMLLLRRSSPDLPRPFRAPVMPATPILGILISLAIMLGLPWEMWLRLLILVGYRTCDLSNVWPISKSSSGKSRYARSAWSGLMVSLPAGSARYFTVSFCGIILGPASLAA
jgi:amino acid transporter